MRRKSIAVILTLVFVAITGNAFSQTTPLVQPKPPKGLRYSYVYAKNYFKAGESIAFMDDYIYTLKVKASPAGKEDVYISLFDLERIYAPDFKVTQDGANFTVQHVGITVKAAIDEQAIDVSGISASLPVAPKLIQGQICVPVAAFMSTAFAKDKNFAQGFVGVGHNQEKFEKLGRGGARDLYGAMRHKLRGKKFGFNYRTYWFEEGQRTMSYRVYVPTTYDPNVPSKMLLLAHGFSVNQNYWFPDTHEFVRYYKPMEEYAEEYGYILVAPNMYVVGASYGDTSYKPPMDRTEGMRNLKERIHVLSGKGFMMGFEDALKHYSIDKNNIFLMGQSWGSMGALYMGNRYSDRFKAIVCTGLLPNLRVIKPFPYPNLVNKPVFFGYGTEDFGGFDTALILTGILDSHLNNFTTYWVAGGHHSNAWAKSLKEIFDFLNRQ
jgi:predicted esterase